MTGSKFYRLFDNFYRNRCSRSLQGFNTYTRELLNVLNWPYEIYRRQANERLVELHGWYFLFFFSLPFIFFPRSSSSLALFAPFYSLFSFFAFFFFYDRPCKFLISTSKSEVMISPYVYILSWKVREAWERSLSFSLSNELSADNFPSSSLWLVRNF